MKTVTYTQHGSEKRKKEEEQRNKRKKEEEQRNERKKLLWLRRIRKETASFGYPYTRITDKVSV